MRESLKRTEIIRHRRDVQLVLSTGTAVMSGFLTLRYWQNPAATAARRIAFLLNSRIQGTVVRNRLKRRLREIYRRNKTWFPPGYNYLIQVKPGAESQQFEQLKKDLKLLTEQIKIKW